MLRILSSSQLEGYVIKGRGGPPWELLAGTVAKIQQDGEALLVCISGSNIENGMIKTRTAKVVFVDVNPDTMNIDEEKIKEAITDKTKAIAVVHYAGISPDMDKVMKIAKEHNLKVVEDAAQGFMAKYKDKYLGTIGDIGCYSFHETKNYSMGEGGAVVINDPDLIERAEIIREKGTNRNKFFRGEIDKYTWVDYGSSYLPSELNCAYLYPQLDKAEEINNARLSSWNYYKKNLEELEKNYPDKNILVVCHGGIVRVIHSYFYDMTNKDLMTWLPQNCCIQCYEK